MDCFPSVLLSLALLPEVQGCRQQIGAPVSANAGDVPNASMCCNHCSHRTACTFTGTTASKHMGARQVSAPPEQRKT